MWERIGGAKSGVGDREAGWSQRKHKLVEVSACMLRLIVNGQLDLRGGA